MNRTRITLRAVTILAAAAVLALVGIGWSTATDRIPGKPIKDAFAAATMDVTELRYASEVCSAGDLADDDHTLIIDVGGNDYGTGDDIVDGVICVLDTLETPASVTSRMEHTRALDGMQEARWGEFEASWTYHPDNGLDLIITMP